MTGDTLARGGKSAVFGPPSVTQEKWNSIWEYAEQEDYNGPRGKLVQIKKKEVKE